MKAYRGSSFHPFLILVLNSGQGSDSRSGRGKSPLYPLKQEAAWVRCFGDETNLLPCQVPNPGSHQYRIQNFDSTDWPNPQPASKQAYEMLSSLNLLVTCSWQERSGVFSEHVASKQGISTPSEQLPACQRTPLSQSQYPAALMHKTASAGCGCGRTAAWLPRRCNRNFLQTRVSCGYLHSSNC